MADRRVKVNRDERVVINREFESVEEFIREYVTNISRSGAFIRSKTPLPVGTKVNLRFSVIMEEIETIEGIGEIVRVQHNPSGMGVVFVQLTEHSQDLIAKLLTRRMLGGAGAQPIAASAKPIAGGSKPTIANVAPPPAAPPRNVSSPTPSATPRVTAPYAAQTPGGASRTTDINPSARPGAKQSSAGAVTQPRLTGPGRASTSSPSTPAAAPGHGRVRRNTPPTILTPKVERPDKNKK